MNGNKLVEAKVPVWICIWFYSFLIGFIYLSSVYSLVKKFEE